MPLLRRMEGIMEIKDILTLIDAVSKSRLSSFTLEEGDTKLSFEAKCEGTVTVVQSHESPLVNKSTAVEDTVSDENSLVITSPMVGTFYASGVENGEPLVSVGDTIKKGQVVGIVEAMKLMNEIESPYDGIVEAICVKNKAMVGFGDVLIKVRPLS